MNISSIFYNKSRNLNDIFHSDEAMVESLSILLHASEGNRRIYKLGESIHSWFNLKLPGTTGKHESSTKQRFPEAQESCDCARDGGFTRLTQSGVTMDNSRPRSI